MNEIFFKDLEIKCYKFQVPLYSELENRKKHNKQHTVVLDWSEQTSNR